MVRLLLLLMRRLLLLFCRSFATWHASHKPDGLQDPQQHEIDLSGGSAQERPPPWSCASLRAVVNAPLSQTSFKEATLLRRGWSSPLSSGTSLVDLAVTVTVTICLVNDSLELDHFPSSCATRFRFLKGIFPVSSSSKSRNAFMISSFGSLLKILCAIICWNSSYFIAPPPSSSTSKIIFGISSFFGSKPRARIATAVGVKEVESSVDFLFLLFGELLLLLPALVEAAERHSRVAAGREKDVAAHQRGRDVNTLDVLGPKRLRICCCCRLPMLRLLLLLLLLPLLLLLLMRRLLFLFCRSFAT